MKKPKKKDEPGDPVLGERLRSLYIDDKGKLKARQSEIADELGVDQGRVSNAFNKGLSITLEMLKRAAQKHAVSLDWLVFGGPQVQSFALRTDKNWHNQSIPLFDVEGTAGMVELFDRTQNIIGNISIPNIPKCDGAIKIVGDSMYPILKSGDIVMYQQVKDVKNGIFWGEMYLVQVKVEGELYMTTVKYVQKSDQGPEYIKLVSHNKHHDPKDVLLSDVRGLAFVKASVRINSMG